MADVKISGLPASTTPLAGTEVLPLVQGGITKQVSVNDLTTGKAISATQVTLTTGDLVMGTAGKGVDFSGVGTAAEILDDYEEGTYTVNLFDALSGGNQSATSVTGYYTKIGRQVTCSFRNFNDIDTTGMTGGNTLTFSLPFTVGTTVGTGIGSCSTEVFTFGLGTTQINPQAEQNQTRGAFVTTGSGVANAFFTVAGITTGVSDIERFTLTYFTT
jgi:hypothetical protein